MNTLFVDTNYLVALTNPKDQWHIRAREAQNEIGVVRLVTTELVLIEVLNYFAAGRAEFRRAAAKLVRRLLADPDIETIAHTPDVFLDALALYESRFDKSYSLIACISMNVMRERGIQQVLTHNNHFAQEGFTVLL